MRTDALDPKLDRIRELLAEGAGTVVLSEELAKLHHSDIAFLLDELDLEDSLPLFSQLDVQRAAFALTEVTDQTARDLIANSPVHRIVQMLDILPMDDAAAIVGELEPEEAERFIAQLPVRDAREVRDLLTYPPDTAGRLMTDRFARARREMTPRQILRWLRKAPEELETMNDIYILDSFNRLVGAVSLREIITGNQETPVGDQMTKELITVSPETDQQDVARLIAQYDLLGIPVVENDGTMLGIVTIDDMMDVLAEELTEDYMRMAGTDAEELDKKTPLQIAKLRIPWLLATMFIELGAGVVIHVFDATIARVILLASFMPIISAISGNTGLQSAAIIIRGLSTGHVDSSRWKQALARQLGTTAILGAVVAITIGIIGAIWDGTAAFGIVVGTGMFLSVNIAGAIGTIIPLLSHKLGFDPALTAGPFETAFQDVVGITIFLGLATAMLPMLR